MIAEAIRPRLGVIGGLGPLASADFFFKFTRLTPARTDAEHVPAVMLSVPQLPARTEAILRGTDEPLLPLRNAVEALNGLGVDCIAIPCNTAHHWYEQIAEASRARIIHIADAVVSDLRSRPHREKIAVLATQGTLASGFYQTRIRAAGYELFVPASAEFQASVDDAIDLVKSGMVAEAASAFRTALRLARSTGARTAVLGCTELSVAANGLATADPDIVDCNVSLARACLAHLGYGASGDTERGLLAAAN
ncbi:amino acid racemase [Bosea sp. 117]|uniref:aspartate/glutamate racemase family protein n=1 Tax=Bosea sp. 117 TaxID=1125973 RepID=UPI00068E885B|nr:amino acid racemase [Bosea sp. 117]